MGMGEERKDIVQQSIKFIIDSLGLFSATQASRLVACRAKLKRAYLVKSDSMDINPVDA